MLSWHFTDGPRLRGVQPLVAGRTYHVAGPLVLCRRGLHASDRAIDALRYAPGSWVSRVELGGEILRTILAERDALRARVAALEAALGDDAMEACAWLLFKQLQDAYESPRRWEDMTTMTHEIYDADARAMLAMLRRRAGMTT